MTQADRIVAVAAVLTALVLCLPVQAQTPEIDHWRALAEQGDAEVQYNLGGMYQLGRGVPQDYAEAVRWYRLAAGKEYTDESQISNSRLSWHCQVLGFHRWLCFLPSPTEEECNDNGCNHRKG